MKKIILILLIACIVLWICSYIPKYKEYFDVVYYDSSTFQNECNVKSVYDNTTIHYDTGLSYNDNIDMGKEHINCCLVEKKFVKIPKNNKPLLPSDNMMSEKEFAIIKNNEDYMNSGEFEYTYTKLKDDKCNINLYQLDSNKQLMIEGENDWNNNMCKSTDSKLIGSLSEKSQDFSGKVTNIFPKEKILGSLSNQGNPDLISSVSDFESLGSCRYANKECFDGVTPEFCNKLKNQGLVWSEKTCNTPLDFKFKDPVKFHVPMLSNIGSSVILFPQPDAIRNSSEKTAILFPPSNPNTIVNKVNNKSTNKSYFSFYHPA